MQDTHICSNCHHEIMQNFCPNCGQKRFKRIDKKYLKDEIQYTLLHTNKGFFYTVKNLLKNPGKTTREFVDGNRVNHYKPILMVFVLSGISLFILNKIIGNNEITMTSIEQMQLKPVFSVQKFQGFLSSYTPLLMLLSIPIQSIFTKIAFYKWEHNYYEHVVINAFFLSFITLVNIIITYPILFLLKGTPQIYFIVQQIMTYLVMFLGVGWFFKGLYANRPFGDVILRLLLLVGISMVLFVILSIVAGIVAAIFFKEQLQQILVV